MKHTYKKAVFQQLTMTGGVFTPNLRNQMHELGKKYPKKSVATITAFTWGTNGIRYDVPTKAHFVEQVLKKITTTHKVAKLLDVQEQTVVNWIKSLQNRLPQALISPIGIPYLSRTEKIVIGTPKELVNSIKTKGALVAALTKS